MIQERPKSFGVNTIVADYGDYVIRKYGCCGMFRFMVGDSVSRRILSLGHESRDEAEKWIDSQRNKKTTFPEEVPNVNQS